MHFNGRFVLTLAQLAARQGADLNKLLSLSGRTIEELSAKECILDAKAYNTFIEAVISTTGDEFFGLHAGEDLNLTAAGLVVQIAQTSDTVRQALEYCCEFSNLGCSALPANLREEKDYYLYTFTPDPLWLQQSPISVRHTLEGYLAFTIKEFQSLTRNKKLPHEVWLTFSRPQDIREMERVLGCPVLFNQPENAIVLDKSHLEEKVISSDYDLLQVLVDHAYQRLSQFDDRLGFYEAVKRSAVNLINPEFPSLEQLAAHLNMSVRTFQRKLKAEGYSYTDIIDELKKDFALSYLKRKELSVSEVAYLLNYAEPGTFIRSFKRWTGKTPNDYRSHLAA